MKNHFILPASVCLITIFRSVQSRSILLDEHIRENIESHADDVNRIIDHVLNGTGHHRAYDLLAQIADDFGPRSTGSEGLELATNFSLEQLREQGFDNVHAEDVHVPLWERGDKEIAYLMTPREQHMWILSSGTSVATDDGGIEAPVIVVRSFEELRARSDEVPGKIVVYNQPWVSYGVTNAYRTSGAARAAELGAVAALVSSVGPLSLYSPHTGVQDYEPDIPKIPVACITNEDAHLMQRMSDRGEAMTMHLEMNCGTTRNITTRNVIAELTGSTLPNETVLVGGHIDSWDVGTGAMDDLGGVVISWEALRIMKDLGLQPKRTVRVIFWNSEEIGIFGGQQYYEAHIDEVKTMSLVMESDSGTFAPRGVGFSGTDRARAWIWEILNLLRALGTTEVGSSGSQADTGMWIAEGVPGANLYNRNGDYFRYHHTHGDTVTVEDPDELDLCTIVWTTVAYVVANIDHMLPREDEHHMLHT